MKRFALLFIAFIGMTVLIACQPASMPLDETDVKEVEFVIESEDGEFVVE